MVGILAVKSKAALHVNVFICSFSNLHIFKKEDKKRLKIENTRFIVFKHKGGIYKMGLRSNHKSLQIKMPGT